MKTSPPFLVSVISAIYKSEKYLSLFLENCLSQTYFYKTQYVLHFSDISEIEEKIVSKYKFFFGDRLQILYSDRRIPIYRAWNLCLRQVIGHNIAVWNVDDLRTRRSLEMQSAYLEKEDVSSVTGPYTIVSEFGEFRGKLINSEPSNLREYSRGMRHGPFFMFRKSCLDILRGFDEQFEVASDFDFCVRLTTLGNVGYTNELLGYYLNSQTGASTSKNSSLPSEREAIYLRYGIYDKLYLPLINNTYRYDLRRLMILGKKFNLENCLSNYDNLIFRNSTNLTLRQWRRKITSLHRSLRIQTFLFYLYKPKVFFKFLRLRISKKFDSLSKSNSSSQQ